MKESKSMTEKPELKYNVKVLFICVMKVIFKGSYLTAEGWVD
jgi:hypothetical protein